MSRASERWRTEFRWALRNLRARGWRAPLAAALLAVALAANSLVFSTADSLVFHRVPYRDAGRLVEIQRRDPRTDGRRFLPAPSHCSTSGGSKPTCSPASRAPSPRSSSSAAAVSRNSSRRLTSPSVCSSCSARVRGGDGRSSRGTIDRRIVQVVVIAESLARERFGDPARAVGQKLETTAEPLMVVGVMPAEFRYPDGSQRIWRALDPRGPAGARDSAASSRSRESCRAGRSTPSRRWWSSAVPESARRRARVRGYTATPAPLRIAATAAEQRRMLLVLVGAALCLLLIACANVASLELANAVGRAQNLCHPAGDRRVARIAGADGPRGGRVPRRRRGPRRVRAGVRRG